MYALWMNAVAFHLKLKPVQTVLDLGCGTGRFTQALAARLGATVIGIDPSRTMLTEAQRDLGNARVFFARGFGEALPMESDSVDVIFMSMVFHHFENPRAVARECRRVLRQGGRLFLRTASREQISRYPYVPYFPTSRSLLEQRLPALGFQCQIFQEASFRMVFSGVLTQEVASDFVAYADKLSLRADSILVTLDDDEFDSGINALRREKRCGPVTEPIDFVVFEKG